MTNLTADKPVADIVSAHPGAAVVFERRQIDYWNEGRMPLADACQKRGLQAADVLAEIAQEQPAESPDWSAAPLDTLIAHVLDTHHVYLREVLPGLVDHAAGLGASGSELAPLLQALREELDTHLMKEEMVLFPLVRGLLRAEAAGASAPPSHCGSVRNPIRVMHMEHDSAAGALTRLRQITDGYQAKETAVAAFYQQLLALERDLHQHMHLENNVIFPRAIELEARFG